MFIPVGQRGRAEMVVSEEDTAAAMGSGLLPVLATPRMIALMENAASNSLLPYLSEGEGSVGIHLDVSHTSATPVGVKVHAVSVVVGGSDREVEFEVAAFDEHGQIGHGTHTRCVIQSERFMEKARWKLSGP